MFPVLLTLALLLNPGPERELVPSTTGLYFKGDRVALGAGVDGFLAVWSNHAARASFFTRLDAEGRAIDEVGVRLPAAFLTAAVAWTGDEYAIAGFHVGSGNIMAMRVRPDGTTTEPRAIDGGYYASLPQLTFDGRVLLLTWTSQSVGTQTVHGAILEPDLDVVRTGIVVATRDVAGVGMLDHAAGHSVAVSSSGFLVAWENVKAPESFTFTIVSAGGEVSSGATIQANAPMLQPTIAGSTLVWHDRAAIYARRVAGDGAPAGDPVLLARDLDIREFAAAVRATGVEVAWTARRGVGSNARLLSSDRDAFGLVLAANARTAVASWVEDSAVRTVPVTDAAPVETISTFLAPSVQLDPDTATDGTNVLAVWSEQRNGDRAARIYGVFLDAAGNVVRSLDAIGDERQSAPRVAFGNGRYLVAWHQGNMVVLRFADATGTFAVATTPQMPELAFDGERFVFVWSDGTTLRSAFVSSGGFVTQGPSLEQDAPATLFEIASGPHGEIAALYRIETPAQVEIRLATLRTGWYVEETLATARRPCLGKRCPDYRPLALGWSNRGYVMVWRFTEGGPYGGTVESRLLRGATTKLAVDYNTYGAAAGGDLVWTGSMFVLALQLPGLEASWPVTYVAALSDGGAPLTSLMRSSASESASAPAIVHVRGRAVAVYNRLLGRTQRVVARPLTISIPRRRAASAR